MDELRAAAHPALTNDSRLTLHSLIVRREQDAYVVGRLATTTFVSLPAVGAATLELLQERLSLGETEDRIERDEDVRIDVHAFARDLIELGFVAAVDGRPLPDDSPVQPHLPWLRPRHVRWLLSRPAGAIYAGVLAAGVVTAVTTPRALPAPSDYFWSSATSLALLTNAVIFAFAAALHELAHLATARAFGVPARIRLSTRLYHLAVQTDVTGMWALPKRARYQVYLAGMAWDTILLSAAVLVAAHAQLPPPIPSLLRMVELSLLLSLAFQFHVYMRTDLYFVLQDLLDCRNLQADARSYLRNRLGRLWGGQPSRAGSPAVRAMEDVERRRISRYAWFMAAGTLLALISYAAYGVPILLHLWQRAILAVLDGVSRGDVGRLLDGTATIAQQLILAALFATAFLRDRVSRRRSSSWT